MNYGSTYHGVHQRLRRTRGSARLHTCAECGNKAEQWAYDRRDPDELVGVEVYGRTLTFSLRLEHYEPLCRPCHRQRDARDSTKCINGHELTDDNVYTRQSGGRLCRTCRRETQRAWREANPGWREGIYA